MRLLSRPGITQTNSVFFLACVIVFGACQDLPAQRFRLRAKCSAERRLSSELVLVRHAKSHFKGMCRDGRGVYDVPDGQEQKMRSMAVGVEEEAANIEERSTRLLISYSDEDNKPAK